MPSECISRDAYWLPCSVFETELWNPFMRFTAQSKAKRETAACGLYNTDIRKCSAVGQYDVSDTTYARPNHRLCQFCAVHNLQHIIPSFHCFL